MTGAQMRKVLVSIIMALLFSITVVAENKQIPGKNKIEPLPRDLEIQLALSALPPHLRDNATVYVLNPDKGFEVARQGTNGFHALVARTGDDTFRGNWPLKEYRDDILYPISFDEAGAKAQMRVFFDAAEMQAKGTPPEELKRIIQDRYRTAYFSQHGRWPETPYPILILHGPHGYMVQFRGVTERDAITKEYEDMLARLCKIKEAWCLPH